MHCSKITKTRRGCQSPEPHSDEVTTELADRSKYMRIAEVQLVPMFPAWVGMIA